MSRAVVFDCDGVLIDSEPASRRAWIDVLAGHGWTVSEEEVAMTTGQGFTDTLRALVGGDGASHLPPAAQLLGELVAHMKDRLIRDDATQGDSREAVTRLAFDGVPLAVASSSPRPRLDMLIEQTGLGRYFEATIAGDEVDNGKPAPDIYLAAAEMLGVSPEACIVIEDTGVGAQAAVAANMRVLGIARDPDQVGPLLAAGAALMDRVDAVLIEVWLSN